MSTWLDRGLCPVCEQPIDPEQGIAWHRVWNDGSGRRELEDYTHAGRCTELAKRAYMLTPEERQEIAEMREEARG